MIDAALTRPNRIPSDAQRGSDGAARETGMGAAAVVELIAVPLTGKNCFDYMPDL
jgi:hypothetical protein